MQYAVLIYEKPGAYDPLSPEERQQTVSAEYPAIRDDPRIVGGARLQPAERIPAIRLGGAVEIRPMVEPER